MRTINDTAAAMLDRLELAGVHPTPADIVRINALAHDLESPPARQQLAKGTPIRAAQYWLWPLTIAASYWYEHTGRHLKDPTAALAYAMAHGHIDTLDTARWPEVRAWYRTISCTRAQLRLAIAEVLDQDRRENLPCKTASSRMPSRAEIVAAMLSTHGGTVEQWERHVAQSFIFDTLSILQAQAQAGEKTAEEVLKHKANVLLMLEVEAIEQRETQNGTQQ